MPPDFDPAGMPSALRADPHAAKRRSLVEGLEAALTAAESSRGGPPSPSPSAAPPVASPPADPASPSSLPPGQFEGEGGYVYEVLPDKAIKIVKSPVAGSALPTVKPGSRFYVPIAKQLNAAHGLGLPIEMKASDPPPAAPVDSAPAAVEPPVSPATAPSIADLRRQDEAEVPKVLAQNSFEASPTTRLSRLANDPFSVRVAAPEYRQQPHVQAAIQKMIAAGYLDRPDGDLVTAVAQMTGQPPRDFRTLDGVLREVIDGAYDLGEAEGFKSLTSSGRMP